MKTGHIRQETAGVFVGRVADLAPIAPHNDGCWQDNANVSAQHHDNNTTDDIGRRILSKGYGTSRVVCCTKQSGFSPAELFRMAGVGKGSEQAKKQRC